MMKRIYISADYAEDCGDRDVVLILHNWASDSKHKISFVDMAEVISGTVANDPDCRPCDLKAEFNRQINASTTVIFVVGDKTAKREAGCKCTFSNNALLRVCTPYKENRNGVKFCKYNSSKKAENDIGNINNYSYLEHEFRQAAFKRKKIIILYNSTRKEQEWLPGYMRNYENIAIPFWKKNVFNEKVGDYESIKRALGVD